MTHDYAFSARSLHPDVSNVDLGEKVRSKSRRKFLGLCLATALWRCLQGAYPRVERSPSVRR